MERRKLMASGATSAGVAIAGCLQWLLNGDDGYPTGPSYSFSLGSCTEVQLEENDGHDEEKQEKGDRHDEEDQGFCYDYDRSHEVEQTDKGMRFTADNFDAGFSFASYEGRGHDEDEPGTIDLRIANDADHPRTVEFDGYVPFTTTRPARTITRRRTDSGGLIVLPDYEPTEFDSHIVEGAPGYVEEGHYWVPESIPWTPEETTSVTLEPGDEIGGRHVLLAPTDESKRSSNEFPDFRRCLFKSEATVRPEDDSSEDPFVFEYHFTVSLSVAAT